MCSRSRFTFALPLALLPVALQAAAPDPKAAAPTSVVLVELFTSEGCSSCPPADALLRQIHLKQTSAGQLIVGLSEHVTYWNRLGWQDPFSLQTFTDRQEAYAAKLSPEGPYTPQIVLNGRDQFVGSNGGALEAALRADSHRQHAVLEVASAQRASDGLQVTFSLKGASSEALDIVAVVTDDTDHSDVLRGENSGRSLEHVSVARSLTRVATVAGDGTQSVSVPLPPALQRGGGAGHHLVLFAQQEHQGAIVAAAVMPI